MIRMLDLEGKTFGHVLGYFSCYLFVDMAKRKRKKKMHLTIANKRMNFQFNKENKVPEEQNEEESDEELETGRPVSSTDHNEGESTQDSSMEENENVLQERHKNANENKAGPTGNLALISPGGGLHNCLGFSLQFRFVSSVVSLKLTCRIVLPF